MLNKCNDNDRGDKIYNNNKSVNDTEKKTEIPMQREQYHMTRIISNKL